MDVLTILAAGAGGEDKWYYWLFHDWREMVITAIASIIVFALLAWKAGPAIKGMWNGRIDRIAKEISDAEAARSEAEQAYAEVQANLVNAEAERSRILAEARQTAEAVKRQLVERGEQEASDLRARAVIDIENAKKQAIADLQAEVAALALGAAEAVVRSNLDQATQAQLIDQYISQVGAAR
ncbi:MAG: F0F1 ATP synthase subunit B [Acidimicrobiales bacterium]|nr:F0F1 ATP synthase subunit B [Acidimicrobiales bacterium]